MGLSRNAFAPPLRLYRFVAASSATLTFYFLDEGGRVLGDGVRTLSVTSSAFSKFGDVSGGIPADAAGVRMKASATVYLWFSRDDDDSTAFSADDTEATALTEAASFADALPIGSFFNLGRVAE